MVASSFNPIARYATFHRGNEGPLGSFRFFGELQAIQGDDTVWITDGSVSVSAELKDADIFALPEAEGEDEENLKISGSPRKIPWKTLSSLPEGAKIFLYGSLFLEGGTGIFRSLAGAPLIVVIYEGEDRRMLRHAIWSGRQMNEYWNQTTPVSLAAGSFSLFLIAYFLLQEPFYRIEALFALILSLLPVLPFFPPGLLFFAGYRAYWRKGKTLRACQDIFYLPMRYFTAHGQSSGEDVFPPAPVSLPDGEMYGVIIAPGREALKRLPEQPLLRSCPLLSSSEEGKSYFVFGSLEGQVIHPPHDPFAEYVAVSGNPDIIGGLCHKKARLYESAALASFCLSMVVNSILAFALLLNLIT